jgi:alkylhydroperoxidase/carboxymuconolactone decarboxylase family protein YurZ
LADREGVLRDLATVDGNVEGRSESARHAMCGSSLDDKTEALVRLSALVALGAAAPSYLCTIQRALDAGASSDEVVDALIAVSKTVGLARVVAATSRMASALGFDIDGPLEDAPVR